MDTPSGTSEISQALSDLWATIVAHPLVTVGLPLVLALLVLLHVVGALAVARDAGQRFGSRAAAVGVFLLVLLPFVGPALYRLLRPSETAAARAEQEAVTASIAAEQLLVATCPSCRRAMPPAVRFCPLDGAQVRGLCACGALLAPHFAACPACGTRRAA